MAIGLSDELFAEYQHRFPNAPKTTADCVTCSGSKRFRWYAHDPYDSETVEYECPCNDQFFAHWFYLKSGIELRYQRLTWTDLHTVDDPRDQAIAEYLDNYQNYLHNGIGMIFTGPPGTGKTMVSSLILKQLISNGIDGHMLMTTDLITGYIAGRWDRQSTVADKQRFDREILNAEVLVVDDLARERAAGATDQNSRTGAESILEDVFRHRTQACLPTILSTNQNRAELGSRYGGHIMNVLDECSIVVEFTGENGRPQTTRRAVNETRLGIRRPVFYSAPQP